MDFHSEYGLIHCWLHTGEVRIRPRVRRTPKSSEFEHWVRSQEGDEISLAVEKLDIPVQEGQWLTLAYAQAPGKRSRLVALVRHDSKRHWVLAEEHIASPSLRALRKQYGKRQTIASILGLLVSLLVISFGAFLYSRDETVLGGTIMTGGGGVFVVLALIYLQRFGGFRKSECVAINERFRGHVATLVDLAYQRLPTARPAPIYKACPGCQGAVSSEDKFCDMCGYKLD